MAQTRAQLLALCQEAQAAGMDFPTLWNEVLKPSPLVIGTPVQTVRRGRMRLEVPLISGGTIAFDSVSNEITAD